MESVMLDLKLIMFIAMEVIVVAVIGCVLIAGLYQIVRDKVLESRRRDQIVAEDDWRLKRA
jgi:hypothetical protein